MSDNINEFSQYLHEENIKGAAREEAYIEYENTLKDELIRCTGLGKNSFELVLNCMKKTAYRLHGQDENGNYIELQSVD